MTQDELRALREKCGQPVPLYRQGATEPLVWLCPACGSGWGCGAGPLAKGPTPSSGMAERAARSCCLPKECAHGLVLCRPCAKERELERDLEDYKDARKVALMDAQGEVSAEAAELLTHGCFAAGDDEHYMDVDELLDRDHHPDYCWPAQKVEFRLEVDAEDALAHWGSHVDWDTSEPEVEALAELEAFMRTWNEKQTAYYLEPDKSVAVEIPGEEP
jgi:hypothetical protein